MIIPTLETPRLLLRGHTREDFEPMAAMWADPQVTRFIGGKPSTREESWHRFLRYAGMWVVLGYGFWVVEEKASGRFAGEMGFADFGREIDPPIDVPEQGWSLAPWAHGKGYATEAVAAALAWGDKNLKSDFMCMISPENAPSIRVAEKAGYQEATRTTYKGAPTVLFRRPTP